MITVNVSDEDCWRYNCRHENDSQLHTEQHYHFVIDECVSKLDKQNISWCIERVEAKYKRDNPNDNSRYRYLFLFPTDNTDRQKYQKGVSSFDNKRKGADHLLTK